MRYTKKNNSIPVYRMIDSRNIEKLKSISIKSIWDALFYKKGNQADGHGRLQDKLSHRKGILDTLSWIITKLNNLDHRDKIENYKGRKEKIESMAHEYPGTVVAIKKMMKLIAEKNIIVPEDLARSKQTIISNSKLHEVSNDRILKAARAFKALLFDHIKGRIELDLSGRELLSAFEVMLLPYYFPHDTKQERNIRFFIHLCKILLNNKVERKKRPTIEQMEQLLTMEQLEGELLIYSQNIIQNTL